MGPHKFHMDATSSYIALLEKTNAQLGLWTNPYAIMVAALSVLIAILAIGVVYIIFRQGNDYRKYFNEQAKNFFDEQRTIFIAEKDAEISRLRSEMSASMDAARQKEMEKTITELEKQKKELAARFATPSSPYTSIPIFNGFSGPPSGFASVTTNPNSSWFYSTPSNMMVYKPDPVMSAENEKLKEEIRKLKGEGAKSEDSKKK